MDNPNSDHDDRSLSQLSTCTETLIQLHTSQIDHTEQFQRFSTLSDYFYAGDEKKDDEFEQVYHNDDRNMMTYLSKLSLESFDDNDDYANEAKKLKDYASKGESGVRKERIVLDEEMEADDVDDDNVFGMKSRCNYGGESDYGGGGLMVITRPKGGRRTLCMNMEEVKACNDLGFELEHERMMEISGSSRISLSASTLDTSSGGNSPIASWRISSPGDDPQDVKARLKVWAQAVAIVSTSSVFKY